LLYPRKLRIPC